LAKNCSPRTVPRHTPGARGRRPRGGVSEEIADLVKDLSPARRERFAAQAARIVASSGMSRALD